MSVHVHVDDQQVDIRFDGIDAFFALTTHVSIPMSSITHASVQPIAELKEQLGWRVGGGYVPGRLASGHFTVAGRKGARQLWSTYRDTEALVIDTTLERPCRIVLQHPDRHDLAWWIGERIAR